MPFRAAALRRRLSESARHGALIDVHRPPRSGRARVDGADVCLVGVATWRAPSRARAWMRLAKLARRPPPEWRSRPSPSSV